MTGQLCLDNSMNIIEISDLTHQFGGGGQGLSGVNLTIRDGEFVVLAGRNGSGKTTLLRHLNGLILPQKGKVKIMGLPVEDHLARIRQAVGMVFQDADSQIVGETVYDDVAFGPENLCFDRGEIRQRVGRSLEAVGLTGRDDHRPHTLSGGEKRRLAIAGILAMEPKVVVLDEPFSNLDYPGIRQVLGRIVALHRSGRTIIVATHDLEKVIAHADRLVIMSEGRIVKDGLPADLLKETEIYGVKEPCASRLGAKIESWLD